MVWYVIGRKWWDSWKAYAKSDGPPPGAIDSSEIIVPTEEYVPDPDDTEAYENVIIQPGLQINADFKVVPAEAWRSLRAKHNLASPLDEIKRYSIDVTSYQTIIEVQLRPILFTWATSRSYENVEVAPL
jgi:hypothetical protein